jgi:hypothetical protein
MVAPTDVSELKALLGTYNCYQKFIKNFARKAAPLNRLLQNNVPWEWSDVTGYYITLVHRATVL